MNIIEFIFKLLASFVPVDSVKLAQVEKEGLDWFAEVDAKPTDNKILLEVKKHHNAWYTKTALAILFIFATRWIHDFMTLKEEEGDEEND